MLLGVLVCSNFAWIGDVIKLFTRLQKFCMHHSNSSVSAAGANGKFSGGADIGSLQKVKQGWHR